MKCVWCDMRGGEVGDEAATATGKPSVAGKSGFDVISKNEAAYGPKYKDHLLDQYKMYVETADNVSSRRQTANAFFLSVNTLVLSGLGAMFALTPDFEAQSFLATVLPAFAGILFSLAWTSLIASYAKLNEAKFCMINAIELELPIAPFRGEWEYVDEGKCPEKYVPMTAIESLVPWFFIVLYSSSIVLSIAWYMIQSI